MMMKKLLNNFWNWYESHLLLNVSIAVFLFSLQLIHLYWLAASVVATRLIGQSFFDLNGIWQVIIVLVDYTEIPAIVTTSLIYIHQLTKRFSLKDALLLLFLNSQWLHLFWITDEYVIEQFSGASVSLLPFWLAWIAILIDFLELPVIYDITKKLIVSIRKGDLQQVKEALDE
jgi:hypothetical protein